MEKVTRVISVDAYHNHYVSDKLEELQKRGFKILSTTRVSRQIFIFGEGVTEICYETEPNLINNKNQQFFLES